MASNHHLFSLLSLLVFSLLLGQASAGHYHPRHPINSPKLFVFGDSYVDTGNIEPKSSSAWMFPYGITFPGVASGRFSDGQVLTDYVARHILEVESPIPFTAWEKVKTKSPKFGMNFAFGGTGVFNTSFPFPNMATQIDHFKLCINSTFTLNDINSSFALVSPSGDDYFFYLANNGSRKGFEPFIISVVNQTVVNLQRINRLGVKKIVVLGLGPIGCYPKFTAPAFNTCNADMNKLIAKVHNSKLEKAVEKLNKKRKGSAPFLILDMYNTVRSVIENNSHPGPTFKTPFIKNNRRTEPTFKTPLKPSLEKCSKISCGSVDKHGKRLHNTLCEYPASAFFWDTVNPTEKGWDEVFKSLKSNITNFFFKISHYS